LAENGDEFSKRVFVRRLTRTAAPDSGDICLPVEFGIRVANPARRGINVTGSGVTSGVVTA
jgi:hypothetical protein